MDSSGRMRRLVVAVLLGVAAAALGYFIAETMARPDSMGANHTFDSVGRATGFVFYVAAFAGAIMFGAALAVQNKLADKKYRNGLVAKAQLHKS